MMIGWGSSVMYMYVHAVYVHADKGIRPGARLAGLAQVLSSTIYSRFPLESTELSVVEGGMRVIEV
jgi:hypothetical protein